MPQIEQIANPARVECKACSAAMCPKPGQVVVDLIMIQRASQCRAESVWETSDTAGFGINETVESVYLRLRV